MEYVNLLMLWSVILIIPCGFGALVSLPALLPRVRKIGQDSKRVRVTKSFVFGLLTIVIWIGGYTWLLAFFVVTTSTLGLHHGDSQLMNVREEIAANRSAIITELWLRSLLPLDRPCYVGQMTICELADATIDSMWYVSKESFVFQASLGAVVFNYLPGVVAGTMAWRFSRPVLPPSNEDVEANVRKIFQQISDEEGESGTLNKS